jgi:hypothetical protein
MNDVHAAFTAPEDVRVAHFRLFFFSAVAEVLAHVDSTLSSRDAVDRQFPFLSAYRAELVAAGLPDRKSNLHAIETWERAQCTRLPLVELRRAAALTVEDMVRLTAIGLADEDGRFGFVFEALHGIAGQPRPTAGLVHDWGIRAQEPGVRASLRRLMDCGLVFPVNGEAPRAQWSLQVPAPVWDALRGEASDAPVPWAVHGPRESLVSLDHLVIEQATRESLSRLPELIARGETRSVLVRGPRHNGRRTIVRAIARDLGLGVLEINGLGKPEEKRLTIVGPLCTLIGAMPVLVLEPAAGESIEVGALRGYDGPAAVIMGRSGGITGPIVECSVTLSVDLPRPDARAEHLRAVLPDETPERLRELSTAFRMTSGHLRAAGEAARSYALLAQRPNVTIADMREASRALRRGALETLATRLDGGGDWSHMALTAETRRELDQLTTRCRAREQLPRLVGTTLGARLNVGIRVLFQGPSGTGKTFAASVLAATLGKDLYRLEISSVVNKYIGETEKNLSRVFEIAEELDVVLLLDEGEALLARRTNVQSSNDRYANLETNFLLQRLESFEGIVIVTTNAADHIDPAFHRRMDIVVDFRPPDVNERMRLWQLHLPVDHTVSVAALRDVASRCHMSGGQVRNAVLHAAVLAIDDHRVMGDGHLVAAVQREYRKLGGICPLRTKAD